jgi:hypothetical protein
VNETMRKSVRAHNESAHPTTLQKLMTPSEVAEVIGVPVKRLYTWRLHEVGPAYIKVGHNLRYRVADVEAWLNANTSGICNTKTR